MAAKERNTVNAGAAGDVKTPAKATKPEMKLYRVTENRICFGCNEFPDVEIVVSNVSNTGEARAKAEAFVAHLRANGGKFGR